MTFDEWMLTKDKSYVPTDDSMQLRLLRECWSSRDAEIAELVAALETVIANAPEPYCAITRAVDAQCRAALAKMRKP